MTDRERLGKIIKATPHGMQTLGDVIDSLYIENVMVEHLLENGVIVPPCKVGQTVYQAQPTRNRVQEYEVTALKFNGSCYFFSWVLKDGKGFYENVEGFSEFQLGATVFLTREEEEKALRGGESDA